MTVGLPRSITPGAYRVEITLQAPGGPTVRITALRVRR
jgi:hypothetical protein